MRDALGCGRHSFERGVDSPRGWRRGARWRSSERERADVTAVGAVGTLYLMLLEPKLSQIFVVRVKSSVRAGPVGAFVQENASVS